MVCVNQTDNSARATTGASHKRSVVRTGSLKTTPPCAAALATSPSSSARRMGRFCSGSTNTAYHDALSQRLAQSSIGVPQARTIQCGTSAVSLTRDGSVVSHHNGRRSMRVESGKRLALRYGSATGRGAGDATCTGTILRTCRSTSITSFRSQTKNCARNRRIWCCFANPATILFILSGT